MKQKKLQPYKVLNWSVDEEAFRKADPKQYRLWQLEQLINYGLNGQKLDEEEVKRNWDRLFMDSDTKRYLSYLLWRQKPSLPKSRQRF